jgi:hypothetical protein
MLTPVLSVHDLAFRAACNAAAAESKRPLRRRVMQRLAASPDTQALIADLQPLVSAVPGGNLLELLASDTRWKTLVAETVADTLGWDDLMTRGASWGEYLSTIWRKLMAGDDQQVARIVLAVIASWGVYRIADNAPIEPIDVKFQVSANTNAIPLSIPVSFVPQTDGASLPVNLDLQTQSRPILLDVAVKQLRAVTAAEPGAATGPVVDTRKMEEQLGEIAARMRRIVELQGDIAGQRHEISLDEKRPRILLVQSLDPTAGYSATNVELCLASVSQPNGPASVRYSIGEAGAQRACSGDRRLSEGQFDRLLLGNSEWTVAVHSVKRRLNGQGRATFSLRPSVPQMTDLTPVGNVTAQGKSD